MNGKAIQESLGTLEKEVGCNTSIINFSMLNLKYLHVYTFMDLNK